MQVVATFIIICSLVVIAGCTGYPRYRSGAAPAETPSRVEAGGASFTTDEYVRLGLLLQSYLGKPYSGSSQYDPGIDCSLFTREVFRQYNKLQLPRTAEEQYRSGSPVQRGMLRYGDLVFFRTDAGATSHVGVYLGYDTFIHASSSRGVIISSLHEEYWARSYAGARRVLE